MLSLAAVQSTALLAPVAPMRGSALRMTAEVETPEAPPPFNPVTFAKSLPGITDPLGFFDPAGFCTEATEEKIRFYREVEIKHCRVAMLASLGFIVAENFHPLFPVDAPSYVAFQQTPLQTFWPAVVTVLAIAEIFSVFTFESPFGGQTWAISKDHSPGDFGWDPLGLKPTDAKELAEMQTKELNNGRLAMFGIAGMVAQELVSGSKLF